METPGFKMDHIVIRTADPERSGRFYTLLLARLGFTKRRDHVFARDGLFFDLRPAANGSGAIPGKAGVDHIGFRADSRAAVDAIELEMQEAGFVGRLIEFDNGDYALFLPDPDGLRFEITCYAEPDAEPVD